MRRGYLDWMRGLAVLIMIEAHTLDSWTRPADRALGSFGIAMIVGGFGAPIFLFLAGVAVSMSAGSKMRRLGDRRRAARAVRGRGWQIFGLAFLFRLQSYLLNPGAALAGLLKVDILNIMGPAIAGAACVWGAVERTRTRLAAFAVVAVACAMLTPLVRTTPLLALLPDPVEWYFRPVAGRTNFTLFPWAGFVFAGALVGVLIDGAGERSSERRLIACLFLGGVLVGAAGYGASFLPPIYPVTNFWTSSPTFFLLRCGVITVLIPLIYLWDQRPRRVTPWSPMKMFGRASLFVYWIHVEMVYGWLTAGLHKRLAFPQACLAFAVFTLGLFGLVLLKNRLGARFNPQSAVSNPIRNQQSAIQNG